MASGSTVWRSSARRRVLSVVESAPRSGLTAQEVATELGLHVSTARHHLDALVEADVLAASSERSGTVGRPKRRYHAPDTVQDATADGVRALAAVLTRLVATRGELSPVEAGRRWAHANLQPGQPWLAEVSETLALWGYSHVVTQVDGDTASMSLHYCPFRDLARDAPEVVCGVHAGLLRGAMEVAGVTAPEVLLEPFVEPDVCSATLTARHTGTGGNP